MRAFRNACLGNKTVSKITIPADGAIVPYDAATVVVTLTAIGSSPLRVHLAHHGADTRELVRPDASQDDGTTRVWRIPVATAGDGPYARQSQWEFWFEPDAATGHYSGDFHVNAVTERA